MGSVPLNYINKYANSHIAEVPSFLETASECWFLPCLALSTQVLCHNRTSLWGWRELLRGFCAVTSSTHELTLVRDAVGYSQWRAMADGRVCLSPVGIRQRQRHFKMFLWGGEGKKLADPLEGWNSKLSIDSSCLSRIVFAGSPTDWLKSFSECEWAKGAKLESLWVHSFLETAMCCSIFV